MKPERFVFELSIPPGIDSDATSFASEGRWADGDGIRFVEGLPQTVGSEFVNIDTYNHVYGLAKRTSALIAFSDQTALRLVAAGGGSTTDVTPASWPLDARPTFGLWGTTMLVNPTAGKLYSQAGTSVAAVIAAAPVKITTILVTPERQVLALGCNEEVSTTFNALCIRGCDLEDYTNWTTSATNNAFEYILEGGGSIVAARMVGSYVAVLTDTALYLGQFLGDPGQTYRFDKIADECGCIGLNALTVADGVLYWLGTDLRLRRWAPGSLPQVVLCTVFNAFSANLERTQAAAIVMTYLFRWGEVRIDYVVTGLTSVSNHITYSIRESDNAQRPVWTKGTSSWTMTLDDPAFDYTLAGLNPSGIGRHGVGYVDKSGVAATTSWFIKTADRYISSARTRVQVQRYIPDYTGFATTGLTLYIRNQPQSSTIVSVSQSVAYAAQKVDFRASGMIMAVKLLGSDSTFWRMGKPTFDCVTMGAR